MTASRKSALFAGPILAAGTALGLFLGAGLPAAACWVAAVTVLCAVWWMFEPIAIPATSIVPFFALPLLGVLPHEQVAHAYGHTLVLLFLGGFVLSIAMERSGTHRRVALAMVRLVGGRGGRRLVLGFMLAAAVLSMWISNTATALMLLPIALAVTGKDKEDPLTVPLLLGIAYASSIGGLGTPIGSPPNLVFMGVYAQNFDTPFSFTDWMKIGVPVVALLIPLTWLWLTRGLEDSRPITLPDPGPWRPEEVRVLAIFALTALLWMTRTQPLGGWDQLVSGLTAHTGKDELTGDSTVALLMALVLFLVPDGKGGQLMDWEGARHIPWGVLLLFGGGIAIAMGWSRSGLSAAVGDALAGITSLGVFAMMGVTALIALFLTEITSNTATANVLMPILAATATAGKVAPTLLMVPAALCCTLAFMLPVGTPPNAIVFSTGRLTVRRMAAEGLVLNLVSTLVVTLACWLLLD